MRERVMRVFGGQRLVLWRHGLNKTSRGVQVIRRFGVIHWIRGDRSGNRRLRRYECFTWNIGVLEFGMLERLFLIPRPVRPPTVVFQHWLLLEHPGHCRRR